MNKDDLVNVSGLEREYGVLPKSEKRDYDCPKCNLAFRFLQAPEDYWPRCPKCRHLARCMICNGSEFHDSFCYSIAM